ncbi:MAG TPA: MoaD/ThiS family protein [Aggregatilineales bacterium]|nr:MoaD/ThiS family protein [Aggregatilineales bacterium]
MAKIKIPTPLRAYTAGNAVIEVSGNSVGAILQDLTAQHPELRQHIFDGDQLRSFVNIYIGPEDTRFRDGLETPVEENDELRIIPSIAGG